MHEWALLDDDDVDDMRIVKMANPASWQTRELLRERHDSPSMLAWQWRRFACGIWVGAESWWITPAVWAPLATTDRLEDGDEIAVGFDGSRYGDATALVALPAIRRAAAAARRLGGPRRRRRVGSADRRRRRGGRRRDGPLQGRARLFRPAALAERDRRVVARLRRRGRDPLLDGAVEDDAGGRAVPYRPDRRRDPARRRRTLDPSRAERAGARGPRRLLDLEGQADRRRTRSTRPSPPCSPTRRGRTCWPSAGIGARRRSSRSDGAREELLLRRRLPAARRPPGPLRRARGGAVGRLARAARRARRRDRPGPQAATALACSPGRAAAASRAGRRSPARGGWITGCRSPPAGRAASRTCRRSAWTATTLRRSPRSSPAGWGAESRSTGRRRSCDNSSARRGRRPARAERAPGRRRFAWYARRRGADRQTATQATRERVRLPGAAEIPGPDPRASPAGRHRRDATARPAPKRAVAGRPARHGRQLRDDRAQGARPLGRQGSEREGPRRPDRPVDPREAVDPPGRDDAG